MSRLLLVLSTLLLLQPTTWAKLDTQSQYDFNSLNAQLTDFSNTPAKEISTETEDISPENIKNDFLNAHEDTSATLRDDNLAIMQKLSEDTAEIQFRLPLEWVNVDQLRNSIIMRFQSPSVNFIDSLDPEELRRLQALHQNALRLGKRGVFGTSYAATLTYPAANSGRNEGFLEKNLAVGSDRGSHQVVRDSRGDNFMRFGRSTGSGAGGSNDFMRFGRSAGNNDFMRFGRSGGDNDFMRFGRSAGDNDFMRFGRSADNTDFMRLGRSPGQDFMRFGRSANQDFMRFGRSPTQDFMRFGRSPAQDFMRFGRSPAQDFMRFGRNPAQDFMRFGRNPGQDFMRFGRSAAQDFMRFGRNPAQDFMRFGRNPAQDFMRFGRTPAQDFMRFGRNPAQDFMRFGRSPAQDFMRFGRDSTTSHSNENNFARYSRPDDSFMRLGKSPEKSENQTNSDKQQMSKNELKQAVKLIHEADKNAERSGNPVDKAMKVLFDKHQEAQERLQNTNGESTQHEDNSDDDLSMDTEYYLKNLK